MSKPSKAIPGIAKGDLVWVCIDGDAAGNRVSHIDGDVDRGRVSRVYKSFPDMLVDVLNARGKRVETVYRTGSDEGINWWRTDSDAAGPMRQSRRARMVRAIEDKRRRLAEAEAELAAFDAEVQS